MKIKAFLILLSVSSIALADNPFKFKELERKKEIEKEVKVENYPTNRIQNPQDLNIDEKMLLGLSPEYFFIANVNGVRVYHNIMTNKYFKITQKEYEEKVMGVQ